MSLKYSNRLAVLLSIGPDGGFGEAVAVLEDTVDTLGGEEMVWVVRLLCDDPSPAQVLDAVGSERARESGEPLVGGSTIVRRRIKEHGEVVPAATDHTTDACIGSATLRHTLIGDRVVGNVVVAELHVVVTEDGPRVFRTVGGIDEFIGRHDEGALQLGRIGSVVDGDVIGEGAAVLRWERLLLRILRRTPIILVITACRHAEGHHDSRQHRSIKSECLHCFCICFVYCLN